MGQAKRLNLLVGDGGIEPATPAVFGMGVRRDYGKALRWYRRAADQGYAEAQAALVVHYPQGEGVPRDEVQGYAWMSIASLRPDDRSILEALSERMTASQIEAARRLSDELRQKYSTK